jgi:SAM-dependent methyltransferase
MKVLQNKSQIKNARKEMIDKRISSIEPPIYSIMRKLGLIRGLSLGDYLKSWDVLETLNFLDLHVPKTEPILDIGCYASEILVALHRSGYSCLTGIDLNPSLGEMPYGEAIRYENQNFMQTKYENASFEAITSISVIAHGFDGQKLLSEISRLLRPGGYFIASFDYWPEKIDTSGLTFFGMDWLIFSKPDVSEFIDHAARYGLAPFGESHFEAQDTPIKCAGKAYTFGWLVLKKVG